MCNCVFWVYLCVFIKILFSSLNAMLIVDKHCCDKCLVSQIHCKSKQVTEQWHGKYYLQSVWGKSRYFIHWKYRKLWIKNKGRSDNNTICLHFLPYVLNICLRWGHHSVIPVQNCQFISYSRFNPLQPGAIMWLHFECSVPYMCDLPFLISDIRAL